MDLEIKEKKRREWGELVCEVFGEILIIVGTIKLTLAFTQKTTTGDFLFSLVSIFLGVIFRIGSRHYHKGTLPSI